MPNTLENISQLSNEDLIGTLIARSRAEGASSYYWNSLNPQRSPDTTKMKMLAAELLRRLPAESQLVVDAGASAGLHYNETH